MWFGKRVNPSPNRTWLLLTSVCPGTSIRKVMEEMEEEIDSILFKLF